ncbi:MAG: AI-2E family transporter [Candidatus Thiodiazotropha sp.]
MTNNNPETVQQPTKDLSNSIIQLALVAIIAVLSYRVFAPFEGMMFWGLILGVALYPMHQALAKRMGHRQGRAATLLVLTGLLIIGLPSVLMATSLISEIIGLRDVIQSGQVDIPPPSPNVAQWPLVGDQLHAAWQLAATDFPQFLQQHAPWIKKTTLSMVNMLQSGAGGVFLFLVSLIVAGIMMAYGESGSAAMGRIYSRFAGTERGPRLLRLTVATIRSVAAGVVGVAFIQALLLGIGFVIAGIPGSGILALIVLLIGIVQLPALLITLPVIGYLWWAGDASTMANVFYTVYLLVAGAADGFLKPMLLGRGVDVPMPVILIGALGGMVTAGIIGLFIGAVILAIAYEVFMAWVDQDIAVPPESTTEDGAIRE